MNNIYCKSFFFPLLLGCAVVFLFTGCDKSLNENQPAALAPASLDETGGTWKTIVIATPAAYKIPAAADVSSSEYQAELQELKTIRANLTKEQKDAVKYWGAGGVFRWNEIIRELIAKHNLAPASNPDGTYSSPDATKPTNYPQFPFANPPYAEVYIHLKNSYFYSPISYFYFYQLYSSLLLRKKHLSLIQTLINFHRKIYTCRITIGIIYR